MIFPKPIKATYDKEYMASCFVASNSLVEFIKNNSSKVTLKNNAKLESEEYFVKVTKNDVTVECSSDMGFFRAMTSLFQLYQKHNPIIMCVIYDKPDFRRRGYMLDISRGRMPKPETIKKLIDVLALLKYNEFQLYMESFVFDYKAYPDYTKDFECLTPEDIKELDTYCKERFIDLVPNQNCFGHMKQWLMQKEFSHLALGSAEEGSSTLNPLNDESFTLVKNIFDSLLPHFSSNYVNVGMDEAYELGKFQSEEYCNKYGKDTLFTEWLTKISDYTMKRHGKAPMFWADMIVNYPDAHKKIPKGAVALDWGYEYISSQFVAEHCMSFKEKGVKFYVCPSCNTHLSFMGRGDTTSYNIRSYAEVGRKYGAEGFLLTDWGMPKCGHPHFGTSSLLPMALGGQFSWNAGEEQNGEMFKSHFTRGAKEFIDKYIFGGKNVSEHLLRASNYYLLEPERVHVGTMCGQLMPTPLSETNYEIHCDLKNYPYEFYFENVSDYMQKIITDIEKIDFDKTLKREILLNCRQVYLSSELCKIRISKQVSNTKRDELLNLMDFIEKEYYTLWCNRNFEKGVEIFLGVLNSRKQELSQI